MILFGLVYWGLNAHAEDAAPAAAPDAGDNWVTDFYYQPHAGNFLVRPMISYSPRNSFSQNLGSTKEADIGYTSTQLSILGAYGIDKNWAAGVGFGYGMDDATVTTTATSYNKKSKGLTDLTFTVVNTTPMGKYHLHYGSWAYLSPSKGKDGTSTTEGNQYTGGVALAPYVGAATHFGKHFVGAYLSYRWNSERTVGDGAANEYDQKIKGGNITTLLGFYEFQHVQWLFDGRLGMANVGSEDKTTSTGTSTSESYNVLIFGAGAGMMLAPNAQIKLIYDYKSSPERSIGSSAGAARKYTSASLSTFTLRGMYEF